MDPPVTPPLLLLINKELHIPLKQLAILDPDSTARCCALLNSRWISHLRDTNQYTTPPEIELEERACRCFLMPSVLTDLPQGWNSFTITVVRKQRLECAYQTKPDSVDSIFNHLINLKCKFKLRDRQLLANCYSVATTDLQFHSTKLDKKYLEQKFSCNVIKVSDLVAKSDLTQKFPPHPSPSSDSTPPHSVLTYFILETDEQFYLFHPHTKVTLLNAVRYSPSLLSSHRNSILFLLYQLKYCLEDLSDQLTSWDCLNLASFYLDPNLWLSSTGVSLHYTATSVQPEKTEETMNKRVCMLQENTRLWQESYLSNFDYLKLVNEAAGRKEGDPNNHPFMPWVSDFKSLGMNSRDFTKSKYRLTKGDAQLDFTYTTPTHSSSLVEAKTEPHHVTDTFSEITYFIYLARRTPRSILCRYVRPRWEPSEYPTSMTRIQEWTPDECIPEFYTNPSIFYSIHPDLPDLKVPHWCDSPESFIRWHRSVLESDYVSCNLHHWIDLYFGYKLTGDSALKAKNIPLFLIKKHNSPYNYGVNQLFKEPHPPKLVTDYLQQYYIGKEMKLSSEQEENNYREYDGNIHRPSIISMEQNNTAAADILSESDPSDQGLYGSCQMDHFDLVQAPPADFTEPLIRKPEESKRAFSDFETTKLKHFPFSRFRGKEVIDETPMLKYRSNISLPSDLNLGRLLDEFDAENTFYCNPSPHTQNSAALQTSNRNKLHLLYQATNSSLQAQIVLVVLFIELLAGDLLKSYPYTAPLSERLTLLRANLREDQLHERPEVKALVPLLDRYINMSALKSNVVIEFPLQFPSYFKSLHNFLSRLYSHKNRLSSLSHLEARECFQACDYSPILTQVLSQSASLLARIPKEGLYLVGDYCKWVFTDSLMAPLAFLEVFSTMATYLPTSYLLNNYIGCIQKVYSNLKDHNMYPFLFKSSFVTSLIRLFGPTNFFSVLLKYLLKAITTSHCSSPNSLSLLSDCLSQIRNQREATPDKTPEKPSIYTEESDTEVVDLINDFASSVIASDTLLILFSYFGMPVSTRFMLSELIALLPDYSCKVLSHITSFERFHNVFLHDTCFVTIHSILALANDKYITFITFHYINSWITQIQKRILNIRTEGFVSAILMLASIWLLSVTNESIQITLYRFFKDIVDAVYQVISSQSNYFTRGVEFRYHLHIALLHLITQLISNGGTRMYPHNISLLKTAVEKIFSAFSAIHIICDTMTTSDVTESDKQNKIHSQLQTTFNADLLSHFSASIHTFLQDTDIQVPSFSKLELHDGKKVKRVFAIRTDAKELVSLFYTSQVSLSDSDTSPSSSSLVSTHFSNEERSSLYSSVTSPSQLNHSSKNNWIDHLKQTLEISSDSKVFTHLQSLSGSETAISKLCYSPCENVIVGSSKEQVFVWKVYDSKVNGIYRGHNKQIKSLSYLSCSDSVLSNDGCINIWSVESMHTTYKHAHPSKVYQVHSNSPQTQQIIYSVTNESTLTVLDTRVPLLVFDWVVPSPQPSTFHHINVKSDDRTIYLATSSGSIIMVDTRMGHILGQWSVSDADISSMLLHQNQLFSASSDNSLRIFSQKGQLYQTISFRTQTDCMEALSDTAVICTSHSDMSITLFQREDSWNPTNKWQIPKLNYSTIHSAAFLPLQQNLLASLETGVVNVYGTNFLQFIDINMK